MVYGTFVGQHGSVQTSFNYTCNDSTVALHNEYHS